MFTQKLLLLDSLGNSVSLFFFARKRCNFMLGIVNQYSSNFLVFFAHKSPLFFLHAMHAADISVNYGSKLGLKWAFFLLFFLLRLSSGAGQSLQNHFFRAPFLANRHKLLGVDYQSLIGLKTQFSFGPVCCGKGPSSSSVVWPTFRMVRPFVVGDLHSFWCKEVLTTHQTEKEKTTYRLIIDLL